MYYRRSKEKYSLMLNIYFKVLTLIFYFSAPFLSQSISYHDVVFLIVKKMMTLILRVITSGIYVLGNKA